MMGSLEELGSSPLGSFPLGSLATIEQIDRRISMRLRQRRLLLGVTQGVVAEALGVSFQQIQKYETGANRISSSRLFELAIILDAPITYFYSQVRVSKNTRARVNDETMRMLRRSETLSLVRHYYMLDPQLRRSVSSMCRSLAPKNEEQSEEQSEKQGKSQRKQKDTTSRKKT